MSLPLVIDMNLSVEWVADLARSGWPARCTGPRWAIRRPKTRRSWRGHWRMNMSSLGSGRELNRHSPTAENPKSGARNSKEIQNQTPKCPKSDLDFDHSPLRFPSDFAAVELEQGRASDFEIPNAVSILDAILTHDLDFGTMLALTHAAGPSVLQVRGQKVLPEDMGPVVIAALRQHENELAAGALVVVEVRKSRVRVLPIGNGDGDDS